MTTKKRPGPRVRADLALVELGHAATRAKAQALIMSGVVFCNEQRVEKAGELITAPELLRVTEQERYVSRGGYKLEGALTDLGVRVEGKIAVDVGASTGGFTDCLLQHGVVRVYAVDVGTGLLAAKLQTDPRVVVMDRTNARVLESKDFAEALDLAVVDASFIGLGKLLPALARILPPGAQLLALVKPQFEVGKDIASKSRGVIRDETLRRDAIERVTAEILEAGFDILQAADCRVAGPKGNVEHFVWASRRSAQNAAPQQNPET